jgi:hypothetical protein
VPLAQQTVHHLAAHHAQTDESYFRHCALAF